MDATQNLLSDGLAAMGLSLPTLCRERLLSFLRLLRKWNRTYNLTAVRDEEHMIARHLLDSLTLLPFLDGGKTMLDVGSGGGLPGIPVAVVRPDLAVTLIDTNGKKTAFLRQAVIELDLRSVRVLTGRVESTDDDQRYDIITSRAFAEAADFVNMTRRLLADGGRWLVMKGVYPYEELAQLPADIKVEEVREVVVPGIDAQRHIAVMSPKGRAHD